jgi:cyclic dehypoxanthinyl futalosine synthase
MYRLSFDIDPVLEGRARLTEAQALELHENASLQDLGDWATAVMRRLHPEDYRTYVIDRNINYTNVCTAKCTFCAFRRDHEDGDSYTLSFDTIGEKIKELVAINGTQILMQGGMNDRLPIEWYEELLRYIRTNFPTVHVHAFSPPEFVEFERFFGLDVREIVRRFKAAGLQTVPGGGGEIFNPRVRRRIGIGKCSGDDWLRVMRVAHEEGLNTSATMLIGHIEFVRERIEHMAAIRDMQDYAHALGTMTDERGTMSQSVVDRVKSRWPGVFARSAFDSSFIVPRSSFGAYTAFIHWPFQRENTPLGRAKEWDEATYGPFDDSANDDILRGRVVRSAGAESYLRTLAIARLFLDNVPSLQSSWVTMGPKVGQLALFYGANDMGSVMMEENVVSAAGTTYRLEAREI